MVKYYRNASQYSARIVLSDGSYAGAGEQVSFNINGVFYTRVTDENGYVTLNINLNPGNYIITAYYKDCYASNLIQVLPILFANDLQMSYGDGSQFVAHLLDGKGNAYANQQITFNINGVFYNKITDSEGMAKLNINLLRGEYIITSSYQSAVISNTITIV